MTKEAIFPKALFQKRLHSLMGFWLTIYLMQHLLINSQAAYFFGADGQGFIHSVNSIHELPFLPVLEIAVLAIPILIHMWWGIIYLKTAKYNSSENGITAPTLKYGRNKAYTWQRITSYLLIFGIIAHVVHMRFLEYPSHTSIGDQNYYMVLVDLDDGIYTLAARLDVELYHPKIGKIEKESFEKKEIVTTFLDSMKGIFTSSIPDGKAEKLLEAQEKKEDKKFNEVLQSYHLKRNQAVAIAKDFGTADLLMLRETFKIPVMILLYTLFVLAACFHAFNGLWTFLISWGVTLTEKSRSLFLKISYGLMFLFSFLGLSAIYATFWNLRS